MSDLPSVEPPTEDLPDTDAAVEPAAKSRPKKPLRRRILRWVLILVGVGILFRLALPLILPIVIDQVAGSFNLSVEYEELNLSLLGGEIEIRDLVVTPVEGGDDIARLGYLKIDVRMWRLLGGSLHIKRADVDGIDVYLARRADGSWPLLDRLAPEPAEGEATGEEEEEPGKPTRADHSLPLKIDDLQVIEVRLHLKDEAVSPALSTVVHLSAILSDLGHDEREANLVAVLRADGILGSLRLLGKLEQKEGALSVRSRLDISDFLAREVSPYLTQIGIEPRAKETDFRLAASLKLAPDPEKIGQSTAEVEVTDVRARTDGVTDIHLGRASVSVHGLGSDTIDIDEVLITDIFARFAIDPSFAPLAVGIALVPPPPSAPPGPAPDPDPAPEAAPPPPDSGAGTTHLRIGKVAIENLRLAYRDETFPEPIECEVLLEKLDAGGFSTVPGSDPGTLSLRLSSPSLFDSVEVSGTASPFSSRIRAELDVAVTAATPDPFRPWLERALVDLEFKRGDVKLTAFADLGFGEDGSLDATFRVSDLEASADDETHRIGIAQIIGFGVSGDGSTIRFGDVTVSGADSFVRIDETGLLHLPGFRILPDSESPAEEEPPAETASAPPVEDEPVAPEKPRRGTIFEVGKITVNGNRARFIDESVDPATTLEVEEFAVESGSFTIGTRTGLTPVEAMILIRATDLAEELKISGTVQSAEGGLDLRMGIRGRSLNLTTAAPWLRGGGIEPEMANGELAMEIGGQLRFGDELRLDVDIAEAGIREGSEEYFRCERLVVTGMKLGGGLHIDRVSGRAPSIRIRWDEKAVHLLGLAIGGAEPTATEPAPGGDPEPMEIREESPVPRPEPGEDAAPSFSIGEVDLSGGTLVLRNDGREDPIDVGFLLEVKSKGFEIGDNSMSAEFDLGVTTTDSGFSASLSGLFTRLGDKLHAELALVGEKLSGEKLTGVLPAGMALSLKDGRLSTKVTADLDSPESGLQTVQVTVLDVSLADEGGTKPVFGLDRFVASLELREETEDGPEEINIDELSLAGLKAEFRIRPDRTFRVLGLDFFPVPAKPGSTESAVRITAEQRFEAFMQARKDPPRIRVQKLHLAVDQVAVIDETPGSEPLLVEDIVLMNPEPIDTDPVATGDAEGTPVNLSLTARASRFIDSFTVVATIRPFANPPSAAVHARVDGIRGEQFMAAMPSLTESIDLSGFESGTFEAHSELRLKYRGKSWTEFDLSRGFDVQVSGVRLESGVAMEDGQKEPVLFSMEEFSASVTRMQPGRIELSEVEIIAPHARVSVDKEGYRILGVLLKKPKTPPEAETGEPTEPGTDRAPTPVDSPPEKEQEIEAEVAGSVISIASFYVSDLSVDILDRSVSPNLHMPITGTEIELRGFTTRMAPGTDGMRFQVIAYSERPQLPDSPAREKPAFDEITVLGKIGWASKLNGWLRASIVGLDLSNLRGVAAENGVTLDSGVLELGLGMRFQDDGGVSLNSTLALRDLSLSEEENGFLYRLLKLPASTDTVIFLLRDHTGTISFSFGLDVPPDGVSTARITSLAIAKISELIALAVLKSPLRVGAGIVGFVGFGAGEEEPEEPVFLAYEKGTTRVIPDDRTTLAGLIERMQSESDLVLTLDHELGKGDIGPVEARYNPKADDCRTIAESLRIRHRRLLDDRLGVLERARASLGTGRLEQARLFRKQLRSIDRSIGNTSREIEQVLSILQRGSERRKARRTREGCVSLGRMRIEDLARQLRAADIRPDRIRYRRPRYSDPDREDGGRVRIQPGRRIDTRQPDAGGVPAAEDGAPASE